MLKFRPPTDLLSSSKSRSQTSSCMTSPPLSKDGETDSTYLDKSFSFSSTPTSDYSTSTSDIESDSGTDSDATLEEAAEIFSTFGHPLERMPHPRYHNNELMCDSDSDFGHGAIYHPGSPCSSCCSSRSHSLSSVTSSSIDYQAIVDDLLKAPDNPFDELDPQNFVTFDPSPSSSPEPPLMIKRLYRDSDEISLYHDLNFTDLRQDPWNPCPHVLQVVDHDPESDDLYLCMERLYEFNTPPMSTVAQYIDFFRQILEGLAFLHEHNLAGFSCSDPGSYMVDLSSGPQSNNPSLASLLPSATTRGQSQGQGQPNGTLSPLKSSGYPEHHRRSHHHHCHHHHHHHNHHHHSVHAAEVQTFDRSIYPVRYYFVNFSNTRLVNDRNSTQNRRASISVSPSPGSTSSSKHASPGQQSSSSPFKQDVKELGIMMDRMLSDVPNIVSTKFKSLIKAMTLGGFGAEDSRKLFEALCRSFEFGIFEMNVKNGKGLRSQSADMLMMTMTPGCCGVTNASCGSTYVSERIRGEFGIEPESVALSS